MVWGQRATWQQNKLTIFIYQWNVFTIELSFRKMIIFVCRIIFVILTLIINIDRIYGTWNSPASFGSKDLLRDIEKRKSSYFNIWFWKHYTLGGVWYVDMLSWCFVYISNIALDKMETRWKQTTLEPTKEQSAFSLIFEISYEFTAKEPNMTNNKKIQNVWQRDEDAVSKSFWWKKLSKIMYATWCI